MLRNTYRTGQTQRTVLALGPNTLPACQQFPLTTSLYIDFWPWHRSGRQYGGQGTCSVVSPTAPVHGLEQGAAPGQGPVDQTGRHGQGCKQVTRVRSAVTVVRPDLVAMVCQCRENFVLYPPA